MPSRPLQPISPPLSSTEKRKTSSSISWTEKPWEPRFPSDPIKTGTSAQFWHKKTNQFMKMKMKLLDTDLKNKVLKTMEELLDRGREELIRANQRDLQAFDRDDRALYDRLVVDGEKVDQMITAVREVRQQEDPVNREISTKDLDNGLRVINKTAPFGTIMIIYESRPDVTVEAAVLAFKANNRILLKGGKEATHSNRALVDLWHRALKAHQ